jgi:lipid-A-disaccharide synthase-like uncharacterized protein
MDQIIFQFQNIVLTPWKLVGFLGTFLFTARWFVQLHATRKLGRVHMPPLFWWLSISGSSLLLAYFIFGKPDAVGIISNSFPILISVYNILIESRHQRELARSAQ